GRVDFKGDGKGFMQREQPLVLSAIALKNGLAVRMHQEFGTFEIVFQTRHDKLCGFVRHGPKVYTKVALGAHHEQLVAALAVAGNHDKVVSYILVAVDRSPEPAAETLVPDAYPIHGHVCRAAPHAIFDIVAPN